jgi:uncharacterized protein
MFVNRDFLTTIKQIPSLEAVLLWGSRQVGKTTLLDQLQLASAVFLDDLILRKKAQNDPALFLDDLKCPCLIDEVQYAPNLFSEIKLRIDRERRKHLSGGDTRTQTSYYLTGSNRLLLDLNMKESLAGRCNVYSLHGFSVKEIFAHDPSISLKTLLLLGGFPELYARRELSSTNYLNSYISSFIEKDIAMSAGISKVAEFQTVLGLLAARTGQFIQMSEISLSAGVDQKTIQFWINTLQRNLVVQLVAPFHSNLSKRITKMKKLYFYDVGLCSRIQGHIDENLLWNSPQAGALFETLVFSEIIKTRDNFLKDWHLFTWRTKDQHEVDFILQNGKSFMFIEAKLAIHGAKPFAIDAEAKKVFAQPHKKIVVTAGGSEIRLDQETTAVPIQHLGEYLLRAN